MSIFEQPNGNESLYEKRLREDVTEHRAQKDQALVQQVESQAAKKYEEQITELERTIIKLQSIENAKKRSERLVSLIKSKEMLKLNTDEYSAFLAQANEQLQQLLKISHLDESDLHIIDLLINEAEEKLNNVPQNIKPELN